MGNIKTIASSWIVVVVEMSQTEVHRLRSIQRRDTSTKANMATRKEESPSNCFILEKS